VELESIVLSDIIQTQKDKYHMFLSHVEARGEHESRRGTTREEEEGGGVDKLVEGGDYDQSK
jgi:hypothetical protein